MSMESVLHGLLEPVFGNEIYPVVHPDPDGDQTEVATLYAIYTVVGGSTFGRLEGDSDLARPRVQISIYGINFDNTLAKASAVRVVMQAANEAANAAIANGDDPLTEVGSLPNIILGVPMDGYEKDTKRFVKRLEYYVWIRI